MKYQLTIKVASCSLRENNRKSDSENTLSLKSENGIVELPSYSRITKFDGETKQQDSISEKDKLRNGSVETSKSPVYEEAANKHNSLKEKTSSMVTEQKNEILHPEVRDLTMELKMLLQEIISWNQKLSRRCVPHHSGTDHDSLIPDRTDAKVSAHRNSYTILAALDETGDNDQELLSSETSNLVNHLIARLKSELQKVIEKLGLFESASDRVAFNAVLEKQDKEVSELTSVLQKTKQEKQGLESEISNLRYQSDTLHRERDQLAERLSKLNKIGVTEENLLKLKQQNESLKKDLENNEKILTETKRKSEDIINQLKQNNAEQEQKITTLTKQGKDLQKTITRLEDQKDKYEKNFISLQNQHGELKKAHTELETSLRNKISELESSSQAQKEVITKQGNKIKELADIMITLTSKLENEKKANTDLNVDMQILYKESEQQRQRDQQSIDQLKTALTSQIQKVGSLEKELHSLKYPVYSHELDAKDVPFVSIQANTLLALSNQIGWKVSRNLPEKLNTLETSKIAVASIIGTSGSGVLWVANQLSNGRLSYGWQHNPYSISLSYILTECGGCFGILESSGYSAPVRAFDKDVRKLLQPTSLEENKSNHMISKRKTDDAGLMARDIIDDYQLLDNDSRIIEDMNLLYSLKQGGIILLVVGRLSKTEEDHIAKVHSMLKAQATKHANSQKQNMSVSHLIVVHNLHWIKTISQAEKEIHILKASSFVEEQPLYNDMSKVSHSKNKCLWKDKFGLTHLIMASDHSEAGDFYNLSTIEFLLGKINVMENKECVQLAKSYAEFCNQKLTSLLGENVEVQLDKERIIARQFSKINQTKLMYNVDYMVFDKEGFKPKYSMQIIDLEGGQKRVIVIIDVLDSELTEKRFKWINGWLNLILVGNRDIIKNEKKCKEAEYLKCTKEDGSFRLEIKLLKKMEIVKHEIDEKEIPGAMKVVIDFKPEEEIFL